MLRIVWGLLCSCARHIYKTQTLDMKKKNRNGRRI